MEILIADLLAARDAFGDLVKRKMPAKLAYGLGKNLRMINQDLEDYDKARTKILEENWKINPQTNLYNIPPEDNKKWQDLHKELIIIDSGFQPYKIDLALTDSVEMTPGEFAALWFIFDGDGDGSEAAAPKKDRAPKEARAPK